MGVFGVIGYKTIVVTDGAVFDSRISYKRSHGDRHPTIWLRAERYYSLL
jgi:hypothetical protein